MDPVTSFYFGAFFYASVAVYLSEAMRAAKHSRSCCIGSGIPKPARTTDPRICPGCKCPKFEPEGYREANVVPRGRIVIAGDGPLPTK